MSESRQMNAYPQPYPTGGGTYPSTNMTGQMTPYPYGFPPQPSGSIIPQAPTGIGAGTAVPGMLPGMMMPSPSQVPGTGMLPLEESYIENLLHLNRGKPRTFYFTFENNNEWNAKVIEGVVEAVGRDHIILSNPETGERYMMLMVNFDYA